MGLDIQGPQYTPMPQIPLSTQPFASYFTRGWFGVGAVDFPRLIIKDQSNQWKALGIRPRPLVGTPAMKRQRVRLLQQKPLEMRDHLGAFRNLFSASSLLEA